MTIAKARYTGPKIEGREYVRRLSWRQEINRTEWSAAVGRANETGDRHGGALRRGGGRGKSLVSNAGDMHGVDTRLSGRKS